MSSMTFWFLVCVAKLGCRIILVDTLIIKTNTDVILIPLEVDIFNTSILQIHAFWYFGAVFRGQSS